MKSNATLEERDAELKQLAVDAAKLSKELEALLSDLCDETTTDWLFASGVPTHPAQLLYFAKSMAATSIVRAMQQGFLELTETGTAPAEEQEKAVSRLSSLYEKAKAAYGLGATKAPPGTPVAKPMVNGYL